ncbi:MAG: sugar ABC transporter permease [Lachnospiraceae bacterium]|nr:sugar ABC transporter permease [Lachnospiraceae bacterium]
MKKNKLSMRGKEIAAGYMFLLPWLIGFFVFSLYPIIYSVMLSLNEVHITSTEGVTFTWKGVQYYYEALRVDTSFLTILGESVTFICFATPIILVFSLVIAILLNHEFLGRTFFRVLFFFPVIIMSGSVISELLGSYTLDFSQMSGVVYNFLNSLPGILQKPIFFALNNLVLILWFCGVQILLFLAALQKVGREVYEAAEVDGAGSWEKFWKITLPHIKSMILVNAVYTVMEIANYSNNEVLEKISSHMFEVTRPYSFSAAMSWIYFLVIAMILLVIFLLFGRKGKNDV